jgi:FHS family glucose/mannose:H+ symporter-like MFS transporter
VYRHSLVLAAACLGMLLFGVTLTTLGSVLPPLIDRHGLDKSSAGSLLSLMSQGILVASLVFGPIVDRYGYKGVLIGGAVGVLLGLEGIAFATSGWFLALLVFVFGFGGGIINGATNALVSDISGQGRSSGLAFLGVFFGLGALGVPLCLGALLGRLDYTAILALFGLLVLVPVGAFLVIRFPPPKQAQGFPIGKARNLVRDRTLLLLGLMLFFQSGMEITVGGWSAQFAHEALHLDESRSVLVLSFFWLGMLAARLALTPLLKRLSPILVLGPFMAIAAAGVCTLLTGQGEKQAMLGLFLIGFGLAAGFPVVLGAIGEIYSELTGTAFSVAFVIALLGGSALPYVTGLLGDELGLRTSLLTVPAGLCMMGILCIIAARPAMPHSAVLTRRKEQVTC